MTWHDRLVARFHAAASYRRAPNWSDGELLTFVIVKQPRMEWQVIVPDDDDLFRADAEAWFASHSNSQRANEPGGVLVLSPLQ